MERDWAKLKTAEAKEAFAEHRDEMVEHFVRLFKIQPSLSRHAVRAYVDRHGCPWPNMGRLVGERLVSEGLIERLRNE